jgi:hypothetical protein
MMWLNLKSQHLGNEPQQDDITQKKVSKQTQEPQNNNVRRGINAYTAGVVKEIFTLSEVQCLKHYAYGYMNDNHCSSVHDTHPFPCVLCAKLKYLLYIYTGTVLNNALQDLKVVPLQNGIPRQLDNISSCLQPAGTSVCLQF